MSDSIVNFVPKAIDENQSAVAHLLVVFHVHVIIIPIHATLILESVNVNIIQVVIIVRNVNMAIMVVQSCLHHQKMMTLFTIVKMICRICVKNVRVLKMAHVLKYSITSCKVLKLFVWSVRLELKETYANYVTTDILIINHQHVQNVNAMVI